MRTVFILLASVAAASTAAVGSAAAVQRASSPAPKAGPACVASLKKADGAPGYTIVRQCGAAAAGNVAVQPIENALGQEEGADGTGVVVSVFAVGAIAGGIAMLADDDDRTLPDDDDGGLDPVSP